MREGRGAKGEERGATGDGRPFSNLVASGFSRKICLPEARSLKPEACNLRHLTATCRTYAPDAFGSVSINVSWPLLYVRRRSGFPSALSSNAADFSVPPV